MIVLETWPITWVIQILNFWSVTGLVNSPPDIFRGKFVLHHYDSHPKHNFHQDFMFVSFFQTGLFSISESLDYILNKNCDVPFDIRCSDNVTLPNNFDKTDESSLMAFVVYESGSLYRQFNRSSLWNIFSQCGSRKVFFYKSAYHQ